jgi:hypothetical protein
MIKPMRKNKSSPKPAPKPEEQRPLTDAAQEFLYKEYDTLRELFSQAEQGAQNIFNFYLTLTTTVIGAVVLLAQYAASNPTVATTTQLTLSALLFFAVAVGSAYLSSLSGRYAHMARYAQAMDELRRYLIDTLHVPTPPIYIEFMKPDKEPKGALPRFLKWTLWFYPTGTYQFFVSALNSLSLSIATWLFLSASQVMTIEPVRSLTTVVSIFVVTLVLFNVYSQFVIRTLIQRLNIRFDTRRNAEWFGGRQ